MKNRILCALFAVALVVVMLAATVGAASFVDVKANAWYAADVDYVAEKGIMKGTNSDKTTFSPAATISRSEVMLMIYNYEVANYGAVENDGAYTFTDIGSHWIKGQAVALKWAQDAGIVVDEDTTDDVVALRPADAITRIEMAEMLYNYLATYKEIGNYINCAEINEKLTVISEYADMYDYADMTDNQFNAMVLMGQMALVAGTPNPDNPDMPFFDPYAKSDRAQAAALFARLDRTTSHVSFDAKVAIGQFNKLYKDIVHADIVYFTVKSADTYTEEAIFGALEKAIVYDADKYDLEIVSLDLDADYSQVGALGGGDSITVALVAKEDPTVSVETFINIGAAKYTAESALDDRFVVALPAYLCVADTMAANQALIQADAEAKLDEFLANITDEVDEQGRPVVYLYVTDGGNVAGDMVEWFANAAMDLYLNPGYAPMEGQPEIDGTITAEAQAALVNDGDTYTLVKNFSLTNVMCATSGDYGYAATKEIKYIITKDSNAIGKKLLWGLSPNLRGNYDAESLAEDLAIQLDRATCADCGKIHVVVKDARVDKVLDAILGTISRKYAFDVYAPSIDPTTLADNDHVTVDYTFGLRELGTTGEPLEAKVSVDMFRYAEYPKNNVTVLYTCVDEFKDDAAEKINGFIANYTCPDCGIIHYTLKDNGWRAGRFHDALSSRLDAKGYYDLKIYTDPADIVIVEGAIQPNVSNANGSKTYIFPTNDERNSTTVADLKALLVKGSAYAGDKNTQAFTQKYLLLYNHKHTPDVVVAKFVTVESRAIATGTSGFGNYVIENKYVTVPNYVTGETKVFCQYDKMLGDAEYTAWVAECAAAHAALPESQAQIARFQASLDAYVASLGSNVLTGTINPNAMQQWAGFAGFSWPVFIEAMRTQEGDLKLVDEGDGWYASIYTGDFVSTATGAWDGNYGSLTDGAKIEGTITFTVKTSAYGSILTATLPVNLTVSTAEGTPAFTAATPAA